MSDRRTSSGRRRPALLIGLGLLALAAGTAVWLVKTRPRMPVRERPVVVPVVDVQVLEPAATAVRMEAMGTVMAADETILQAEVSGRIVAVHPQMRPGGRVKAGTVLVEIDDRNYRLALAQRRAELDQAQSQLRIEAGSRDIARAEWDLIGSGEVASEMDHELALREPQWASVQAQWASASAAVERAELDLARTRVHAPFDAVVLDAPADVGDQAAPGGSLARLAGTERWWVEATVKVSDLRWIQGAAEGAAASVQPSGGGRRSGRILSAIPEVDEAGRMARVLIEVQDPLLLKGTDGGQVPLLLNDYVRVVLQGRTVEHVAALPRAALREGSRVWMLDDNGRLQIEQPRVLWSTVDTVYVHAGSLKGRRLIVSALSAPVDGMIVREQGATALERRPAGAEPDGGGRQR